MFRDVLSRKLKAEYPSFWPFESWAGEWHHLAFRVAFGHWSPSQGSPWVGGGLSSLPWEQPSRALLLPHKGMPVLVRPWTYQCLIWQWDCKSVSIPLESEEDQAECWFGKLGPETALAVFFFLVLPF